MRYKPSYNSINKYIYIYTVYIYYRGYIIPFLTVKGHNCDECVDHQFSMGVLVPVARHWEWNRLHLHQRHWDETGDEGHQQLQLDTKNIRCRNGMTWGLSWKRNCEVGPSRVHLNPSFLKCRIKHTLGTLLGFVDSTFRRQIGGCPCR